MKSAMQMLASMNPGFMNPMSAMNFFPNPTMANSWNYSTGNAGLGSAGGLVNPGMFVNSLLPSPISNGMSGMNMHHPMTPLNSHTMGNSVTNISANLMEQQTNNDININNNNNHNIENNNNNHNINNPPVLESAESQAIV